MNRQEFGPEARERLTMWATENYKHERARFPFGVYANPTALRADILSALAEIERLYERQLRLEELVSHADK